MYQLEKYLEIIDDVLEKGPYKPTWESLSAYELPTWYRNAKFGIFVHWLDHYLCHNNTVQHWQ